MYYPSTLEEFIEPVPAKVIGNVPAWLEGSLYRNGPGTFQVGDSHFNHLFDGMAKVNKFSIKGGKVTYQSRFLKSETYKKNTEANRIVVSEFGTMAVPDPCKNVFQRFMSRFEMPAMTDNCVVNVYRVGDGLFACTETDLIHRVDWDTLDTMKPLEIGKLVTVNSATAHPHTEPDGTIYNIGCNHKTGHYAIIKMTPPPHKTHADPEVTASCVDEAQVLATVPMLNRMKPAYFHSFALTENYIVMVECPLSFNIMLLMTAKLRGKPLAGSMEWNPKQKTLFHIIDKHTGANVNKTHKYQSDSFFVFHHANAYEENGNIVMDLLAYTDGGIVNNVDINDLMDPKKLEQTKNIPLATGRRYVLPVNVANRKVGEQLVKASGSSATAVMQKGNKIWLTHESMSETTFEFPRYNYAYNGKKYRYLYGVSGNPVEFRDLQLYRRDMETGEELRWGQEKYTFCEPVFAANPFARSEDDGVILSIGVSPDPGNDTLLIILDARTMKEIARAEISVMVHRDFHGEFYPGKGVAHH